METTTRKGERERESPQQSGRRKETWSFFLAQKSSTQAFFSNPTTVIVYCKMIKMRSEKFTCFIVLIGIVQNLSVFTSLLVIKNNLELHFCLCGK